MLPHWLLHDLRLAVEASVILASIGVIVWWVVQLPKYVLEWRSWNIEIMTVWTFAWRESVKLWKRIETKMGSNRSSTP